ncbi:MAG TPA: DEAD/DEAH box helicase [Gemmataceae bacterium]|jgi:ATP-dependent RNA helicase RhlE|nr:DEAD/DEAH box helicase [Gemmataceae bacterium]
MPFKALGLHAPLVQATREMRYTEPTPIQAEAIPAILAGRDLIAMAQTGTGKTAAFLLPILHQFLGQPLGVTRALIITPTRELAQQIDDVCLGLAYHTPLRVGLLVGGAPMGPQEKALRAGVEMIIATPGRLLDHMRQNQARFDRLHTLVLDEADRMLDMGFLPDIKRIVARLPGREQTLLFSATIPPVIVNLAKEILRNPLTIQVGQRSAPAVGITQAAYPVAEHLKTALLRYLLRHMEMPSVLVFTRTKQSARRLARAIAVDGFAVTELHSNLTQPQRNRAMEGFRRGDFQVLVATNIAARGLDVLHITHVISFDVPSVPDDYVHRIGRTARAQAEGDAFILVSPVEEKSLGRIERQIGQRLPRVTLPDFDYSQSAPERAGKPGQGHRGQHGLSSRAGSPLPRTKAASRNSEPGRSSGNRSSQHPGRSRRRRR